ncbi:phage portal protein (plasmid) [Azospirillum melinis]|uniref:phage portal protein n=1 Tax=Azospirillum melinis TaxID=328839 RepID=UPI003757FB1F
MTDTVDTAALVPSPTPAPIAFTFGDPEPVLDGRDLASYYQSLWNGSFYEPPVSFDGLAKALTSNPHHESALRCKTNILASCYRPHKLLSRADFKRLAFDYLVFGNAFLERETNWLGGTLKLRPSLARWTRTRRDGACMMLVDGQEHDFAPGSVLHLMDPDINQEIYGLPGYLGALQSALLNEAATLFRRKYYRNGSHAGFILYMSDAAQNLQDVDKLREALRQAKGPGNFRNLFMYAPNGKPDGLKVIPVAEVGAKDEFLSIKNVTRDDVLAAHRVPPQLLGIVPNNTGGFGDAGKAAAVFARNELRPLSDAFADINAWLGEEVVTFDPYAVDVDPAPAAK